MSTSTVFEKPITKVSQLTNDAGYYVKPASGIPSSDLAVGAMPNITGGSAGDLLAKRTNANNDVEWITPANSSEQNNTRPITAAAVYTEIGNINALLSTI